MLYHIVTEDSITYYFENRNKKNILKSGRNLRLMEQTGLIFIKEYTDYLFFIHEWISGCCTPPDLVFIDKNDSKELIRINHDNFIYENQEKDYVMYFNDTTQTHFIYHNLETNKKQSIEFKEKEVKNSAVKNEVLEIHYLFEVYNLKDGIIKIEFKNASNSTEKYIIFTRQLNEETTPNS